jgi:hypothetical protein
VTVERVTTKLDAAQIAWSRLAKRWGELTSPDSRADPALARAASEVRAAISETACSPTGWATPGVHDPGTGSGDVGPGLGRGWLHILAVTLHQRSGLRQLTTNLEQALILRAGPGPMPSRAATNTVPQAAQP